MSQLQPNVLFIIADQWRADCLGFDGHPAVQTPHLDDLFYHGVHFRQAYAAVPTCVAARCSIMTGLTPRSHGRVGYADDVPWDFPVLLPGLFSAAGYHTQCVGKLHATPERALLGFHNVILHDGWLGKHTAADNYDLYDDYRRYLRQHTHTDADVGDTGLQVNSWAVNPWPYDERHHPTNWAVTEAIDFLRRRDPAKPFFLNLSLVRPHPPFDPPQKYLDIYRDATLPPVAIGDWCSEYSSGRGGLKLDWTRGEVASAQLDRARRAYYALITQIDFQLNRLFLALRQHDVADNTVICFVSDHGEMLGDHHFHAKAMPFDGSARVPWLMRFPDSFGIAPRQVRDEPVELRDLLPTLCDAAGIEIPASVEGRSVLPICRGESPKWREYIHGEHARPPQECNQWVTDGREKYVWFSQTGRELLFDLTTDPKELRNLANECPARVSHWRQHLVAELTGREEGYVENGKLVVGRPPCAVLQSRGAL